MHERLATTSLLRPISVSEVSVGAEEEALVLGVLRSGHLAQGPMVERLEAGFADLVGTRHAVAVGSGTAALALALAAEGIGPGEEVLTSPFTFVATLNAILVTGATARFVDIDAADYCIDISHVEERITPRTRVVLPVHLYGQPTDMDALCRVVDGTGVALVEDAAQAVGATVGTRHVGSYGTGCFSLYATKNLTAGEGGIVTTDDDRVADHVRVARNQGMRQRYEYESIGFNHRLTDLQAAVGVAQLDRLDVLTAARRRNAARLDEWLADVPGLVLPPRVDGRHSSVHQYTIRVDPDSGHTRDGLAASLAYEGIGTGVYYPRLVHDHAVFRAHPGVVADPTPVAERISREVLSLPIHPSLTEADLNRVAHTVRTVMESVP